MKILITRSEELASEKKSKLVLEGHQVFCLALTKTKPPSDHYACLDSSIQNLGSFDWLIFTSFRGVEFFGKRFHHARAPSAPFPRVAAVGPKTAASLKKFGWKPNFVADGAGEESLIEYFKTEDLERKSFLMPKSENGLYFLEDFLREKGGLVTRAIAYQTATDQAAKKKLVALLKDGIESVYFFSPSQVDAFWELAKENSELISSLQYVANGSTTESHLRKIQN